LPLRTYSTLSFPVLIHTARDAAGIRSAHTWILSTVGNSMLIRVHRSVPTAALRRLRKNSSYPSRLGFGPCGQVPIQAYGIPIVVHAYDQYPSMRVHEARHCLRDAIQFPTSPPAPMKRSGGSARPAAGRRCLLGPVDRNDERLSPRIRRQTSAPACVRRPSRQQAETLPAPGPAPGIPREPLNRNPGLCHP
jgi:hypothetical protein